MCTQYFTQSVLPIAITMLTPEKPWNERQKGLRIARTVRYLRCSCYSHSAITEANKGAASLLPYYVNLMMQYLSNDDGEVRQAATFGIGAATVLGDMFTPFTLEVLRRLFEILSKPAYQTGVHVCN
eukprot:TRINITY_DN395_c1_g2_i3.p2 TRINITY_DN395_c1_g2~~TRINITY_DN395_c1_g2_i3.p2  ORF type:complete len:126 (-),score=25.15 TRINITY_DN395_c1_g2_i3:36-413(-)